MSASPALVMIRFQFFRFAASIISEKSLGSPVLPTVA
jgi:hypothetical protein